MISIIKQIQASITCEAKWLRWVWRECKRKAKYTIYTIKYQLPLKPSHMDGKQQFPPANQQIEKNQGVWWRCRSIVSRCLCISSQCPPFYMISQKVVSPLNMSHIFVEDWIFRYWDGTVVIAHEGDSLKPHSKICHGVHYPKNLWVVATYSASVVDCATEDCFREDQQTREDPRKWQVPEVLFWSISQPAKSALEKLTRSSEEAEYQIPNSGVCLRYLKTRWTAVRCKERGEAWKRAHSPTTNWMSSRVAVRYRREPIILLYSL
jgi:hypothetical protein